MRHRWVRCPKTPMMQPIVRVLPQPQCNQKKDRTHVQPLHNLHHCVYRIRLPCTHWIYLWKDVLPRRCTAKNVPLKMYRKGLYCATKMYYHEDVLPQGFTAKMMPPRMYCIGLTAQDVSPTMYRKGLHRTDSSKECATGCTGRRM